MSIGTIRIPASEKGMLPAIPALGKQNEVGQCGLHKTPFQKIKKNKTTKYWALKSEKCLPSCYEEKNESITNIVLLKQV